MNGACGGTQRGKADDSRRGEANCAEHRQIARASAKTKRRGRELRRLIGENYGLFYDETDDTPTKIGRSIGSILAICVYAMIAWLIILPLWHLNAANGAPEAKLLKRNRRRQRVALLAARPSRAYVSADLNYCATF